MATTAVDVKELAASYVFIADMPGLKHTDIKVSHTIFNSSLTFAEKIVYATGIFTDTLVSCMAHEG